jgi:protease I
MKKAIIIIDNLFQDAEVLYPYYRLQEAGFKVDLVAAEAGKEYQGKRTYPMVSDKAAKNIKVAEYDLIIIPGGFAPDTMRRNPAMVNIVKEAYQKGKVIGSICHGAWMLAEADIIHGKKVTCFSGIKTDIINAGGKYVDKEVVVDGSLITSRKPDDLPAFMREVLKKLGE